MEFPRTASSFVGYFRVSRQAKLFHSLPTQFLSCIATFESCYAQETRIALLGNRQYINSLYVILLSAFQVYGELSEEEVRQDHVILDGPSFFNTNCIVKSAICYRAVKVGYCFDILRNESASTDKLSEHQGPW